MTAPSVTAPAPPAPAAAVFDANSYLDVVDAAHRAPAWLDSLIGAYSTHGPALFAVLMLLAWQRARHQRPRQAVIALAAPLLTVPAFGVSSLLKPLLHESRPCQSIRVVTPEACPAPGDWSFPSNHAALAAAAAAAIWCVSVRLGAVAAIAATAMGVSRVWVGAHYPHDIAVGLVLGALVAGTLAPLLSRHAEAAATRLSRTRLRPLVHA
ncbi:phosphatase PAP2 family protein [Streptomyces sp. NPDC001903]|uniref:phosphatase PAP2 family protein n=1 Tax=Streptomyces sp. NPDC001903 TaxID=3364622 RepID=UPI0036B1890C